MPNRIIFYVEMKQYQTINTLERMSIRYILSVEKTESMRVN